MSGTVYPWTTTMELEFLSQLGTHVHNIKHPDDLLDVRDVPIEKRLRLLRHYRDTAHDRDWDSNIDVDVCVRFSEEIIHKLERLSTIVVEETR